MSHINHSRKKETHCVRPSSAGRGFESLEIRRLLSGFSAFINFQPATAPVPAGYVADSGAPFADRGNGFTYGWNGPHKAQVLARHLRKPTDGVDNRYDTYAVARFRGAGSLWEIAVPDGTYQVDILAGDPKATAGRNTLEVDGAVILNAKVTPKMRWSEASGQFTVSDGLLELTVPRGHTAKIDSIDITQIITTPPVVTPTSNSPYLGTPFGTDQVIPAADFDTGGEGIAYHDTTPANLGNDTLRSGDGVDLDTGGSTGNVITDTEAGEWMDYTINVATAGSYVLDATVANSAAGGSFHAEFEGTNLAGSNLTGPIAVTNTGSATSFQTVTSPAFSLPAGQTTMRIVFDQDASGSDVGNFDSFQVATPPAPPVVMPLSHALVWRTAASAPQALAEAQGTSVNGKLYMFGGYNITSPAYEPNAASEVYDPVANQWTTLARMPVAETHMGVASDGTYIYVAGGYTYNPTTTYQVFGTTNVFRYDIATNTWSTFVPLPAPIGAGTMVLLGTQLHFFDGVNPSRIGQTEHWVLDLSGSNPQWTNAASPPFSRNHMTAVVLNGKIYAIGGQPGDDDSQTTADMLIWDPANPSTWTIAPSMPIDRSHAVTAVVDGEILVVAGTTTNDVPITSSILFNPATNAWTTQTPLPSARLAPVGGLLGNEMVVTTGFGNGSLQATTWVATI